MLNNYRERFICIYSATEVIDRFNKKSMWTKMRHPINCLTRNSCLFFPRTVPLEMEAWICCQPLSMNKIQARVFLRKMLGTWLDLQGPDFY